MPANQTLANILDETIVALSNFDLVKLQALEQQIAYLEDFGLTRDNLGSSLQKKQTLEIFIQNCGANLGALRRLHAKNMRNQWAQ